MPKQVEEHISTKTHPAVAVYLLVAIGFIVGTVALIAYLFSGK